MNSLRIAVVEVFRSSDPRRNIMQVLDEAGNVGEVDVVALPENWLTNAPIDPGYYASALEEVYNAFNADVLGGLSYIAEEEGPVSAGYAILDGKVVRICEKMFPSKAVGERGRIRPGRRHGVFRVRGIAMGCIACVDIFYPEVSRGLAREGALLLYNPAAIPLERLGLWHGVLSTRAAENIVFTLGVNGGGYAYPDGRVTGSSSFLALPDGSRASGAMRGRSIVFEIDPGMVERVSSRWAFREDYMGRPILEPSL